MSTTKLDAIAARFLASRSASLAASRASRSEVKRAKEAARARVRRRKEKIQRARARAKAQRQAKLTGIAAWKKRIADRALEDRLVLPPPAPSPRRVAREVRTAAKVELLTQAPKLALLEARQAKLAAGRLLARCPSSPKLVAAFQSASSRQDEADSQLAVARYAARRSLDKIASKKFRREGREALTPKGRLKSARADRRARRALRVELESRPVAPSPAAPAQPIDLELKAARQARQDAFNARLRDAAPPPPIPLELRAPIPERVAWAREAEAHRALPREERLEREEAASQARYAEWQVRLAEVQARLAQVRGTRPRSGPAARASGGRGSGPGAPGSGPGAPGSGSGPGAPGSGSGPGAPGAAPEG